MLMKLARSMLMMVALAGLCIQSAWAVPPVIGRFSMDRQRLVAGEAFLLTLEIQISGETLDKEISISALPAPGELQIRSFEELPGATHNEDGQTVETRRFRTWARMNNPGTITLAPRLDGTLVQTSRTFFFMQEVRRPIHIPVEPFPITALPLPAAGKPAGFSGLVGNFNFTVMAAPLDIAPGDLITLTFTIEGDWLPEVFTLPQAAPFAGLKVYESKPVPGESGPFKRVFRQTVIPEDASLKALPAFTLVYFDSREARYKTRTAGPFPITYHAEQVPLQAIYAPTQRVQGSTAGGPAKEISVRFGPSESARELFTIKADTPITVESNYEDWIRISCEQGIGWIPKERVK